MDTGNPNIPVIILGDLNTSLPQMDFLTQRWFTKRPFNRNSVLLYNFIEENNFCVANFICEQNTNYTFSKGSLTSYIDHILMPYYLVDVLEDCKILSEEPDNVSDHFALTMTMKISTNPNKPGLYGTKPLRGKCRPQWKNHDFQTSYRGILTSILDNVSPINLVETTIENASKAVNSLYKDLCEAMLQAAEESTSYLYHNRKKTKQWWNNDCWKARNRNRLFHKIWKSCGSPDNGTVYDCYKSARKQYRRACRLAMTSRTTKTFALIERYARENKSNKMWNVIKQTKRNTKNTNKCTISHDVLENYFREKFDDPKEKSDLVISATNVVKYKYEAISREVDDEFVFSEFKVKKFVRSLKCDTAAGVDDITGEHLKHALDTSLPLLIANMFTVCIRHGVIPDLFCQGMLTPILKKVNLDPLNPKNYRPITVSVVLSKILEQYMLEEWSQHKFNSAQFGFIEHRSTNMATVLAHDIGAYCNAAGSSVFYCSLDAEAAFDALPHSVILEKAIDIVPDLHWRILFFWYKNMSVAVKSNMTVGNLIQVNRGIRQGGLTSPYLYNLFYESLISELNSAKCGVTIGSHNFNVFNYADDILLCSTTSSGLQCLIDIAVGYVSSYGLSFNPHKTECLIKGVNPFNVTPTWKIKGVPVSINQKLKYLGTILDSTNSNSHVSERVQSANKAFYSLQAAGLKSNSVSPQTAFNIYCSAVRSVLTFGCCAIYINKTQLENLNKTQGKYVKSILGINFNTHTTPILKALSLPTVSTFIDIANVNLLKSCIFSDSLTQRFYLYLLRAETDINISKTLLGRVKTIISDNNIMLFNTLMFKNTKSLNKELNMSVPSGLDGTVDTIRFLLNSYDNGNRRVLNNLLKAF